MLPHVSSLERFHCAFLVSRRRIDRARNERLKYCPSHTEPPLVLRHTSLVPAFFAHLAKIWDCEGYQRKANFYSRHEQNVFQARALPYTDNEKVSCCPP